MPIARGINGLFARPNTASYLLDGLQRVVEEVRRLEQSRAAPSSGWPSSAGRAKDE
ncbi:MAG: hypothetical protein KA371_13495 [Acidobacteria bacterium]|nr:hypothetical protein [Acidobacteriota bacterium]